MLSLDGAYEPSHIGPRAEITGDLLTLLWRGSPTLSAHFTALETGGRVYLKLDENGLRNTPDSDPYATVKEVYFEDGRLTVLEDFPFSGESTEVMERTENNRYGNVTLVTGELLPLVQGSWKSDMLGVPLRFEGDYLVGLTKTRRVGLKRNYEQGGRIYIADADPARSNIEGFYNMYIENGRLFATVDVCDAPSIVIEYVKK